MWLRLVSHVVDPAHALLNAQVPPLGLAHEVCPGHQLGQFLGQHHVSVLVLVVVVLVRVVNVLIGHGEKVGKPRAVVGEEANVRDEGGFE